MLNHQNHYRAFPSRQRAHVWVPLTSKFNIDLRGCPFCESLPNSAVPSGSIAYLLHGGTCIVHLQSFLNTHISISVESKVSRVKHMW